MNELMLHVEKAVRPLRAPQRRRREIREELLCHLQGVYDEELQKFGNHESAVKSAIERFGSAEDLTVRLKAALPWHAVIMSYVPLCSPVRTWPLSVMQVGMGAWITGLILWLIVGIPWGVIRVVLNQQTVSQACWWWLLLAAAGAAMLIPTVGIIGATNGVYAQAKSKGRVLAFCLLQYLMLTAIAFALTAVKLGHWPPFSLTRIIAPAALPLLVVIFANTKDLKKAIQLDEDRGLRTREWEHLDLS